MHWWSLEEPRELGEIESKALAACDPCFLVAKRQAGLVVVHGSGEIARRD